MKLGDKQTLERLLSAIDTKLDRALQKRDSASSLEDHCVFVGRIQALGEIRSIVIGAKR